MSTGGDARCTYTHDVSSARFADIDGSTWRCPHPTHNDTQFCPFHFAETGEHQSRPFESIGPLTWLATEAPPDFDLQEKFRLIGATLPEISIRHTHLGRESNAPVDLRDSTIHGDILATEAYLDRSLLLDGATVHGTVDFSEATLNRAFHAEDADFHHGIQFDDATTTRINLRETTINGRCQFRRTEIRGDVTCHGAVISRVSLERAAVTGDLDLTELQTTRRLRLDDTTITGQVSMLRSTLSHGLWATGVEITDGFISGDTSFHGPVHFDNAEINGQSRFNTVTFHDETSFRDATIDELLISGTPFKSHVTVASAEFDDLTLNQVRLTTGFTAQHCEATTCTIKPTEATGTLDFQHSVITNLTIDFTRYDASTPQPDCDFRHAVLTAGHLGQPTGDPVMYDLRAATLGDLTLDDTHTGQMLDWYRFARTTFDGFDFTTIRAHLDDANWSIHTSAATNDTPGNHDPTDLETTYLKAKTGAQQLGDDQAVSQFFRKEMTYRRHRHQHQVTTNDSLSQRAAALNRYVYNLLLALTTGHGELSRRVLYSSGATILVFAGLYRAFFATVLTATSTVDYLIFSSQTFITFIVDSGPAQAPTLLNVLTVIEGFLGAFFVALFVFTLTRSVNR